MSSDSSDSYNVFTRAWWREATPRDGNWPRNLVPAAGAERTYLARGVSYSEARELCDEWNSENEEGRYSVKAEFERA
jgi:hypothetical protein